MVYNLETKVETGELVKAKHSNEQHVNDLQPSCPAGLGACPLTSRHPTRVSHGVGGEMLFWASTSVPSARLPQGLQDV